MELDKQLRDKLHAIEGEVSQQWGDMSLFALFLREDAPNRWDLVVAAPWVRDNRSEVMKSIAKLLREKLLPNEIVLLSRIVLLESTDPGVIRMNRLIQVLHEKPVAVEGNTVFGLPIASGYVVTSQRLRA